MDIHGGTCLRPVQSYMMGGAFLSLPMFLSLKKNILGLLLHCHCDQYRAFSLMQLGACLGDHAGAVAATNAGLICWRLEMPSFYRPTM